MSKLFAVFLKALHRTEIVALAIVIAYDSLLLRNIHTAYRIAVCHCIGFSFSRRLRSRFLCCGQRENNAVTNV